MKKPLSFRRLGVLTTLVLSLSLTACSDPLSGAQPFASGDVPIEAASYPCAPTQGKEPAKVSQEVAVIAAPTNTFVRFSNAVSTAEADLRELLNKDGVQLSTVLADGQPMQTSRSWVDFSKAVFQADKDKAVNRALGKVRMTYYCAVMSKDQNPSAYTPVAGADFLASLQVAASTFTHSDANHEIVVLGNGLQDVGQIDLNAGFPQDVNAAKSIVNTLKSSGALPDLTDVKVRWFGLGQNDRANQKQLHPIAAKSLEAFWTAVIEASGGELEKVVGSIPYADPVATALKVTPIEIPAPPCVFMLTSDDGFNFEPDSATFLNLPKAKLGAKHMADDIDKSKCGGPLYVVGYAASGVDKADYDAGAKARVTAISTSRASAFLSLLSDAGVSVKLVPFGAGKGPTLDWDEKGNFIEALGKANRYVEVTQSNPAGN